MKRHLENRKILFITTKNLDYIRNQQEIKLIKEHARSYRIIGSSHSYYPLRLFRIYLTLMFTPISTYDVVFAGFAPQLILPLFHWKFKKKYIIEDFFISLYDTFCHDRQKIRPDSLLGRLLHFIDHKTLSYADIILCDTHIHGQYFVSEFGADSRLLHTLYLEADMAVYHPMVLRRPPALRNKYVVLYFGSILPLQGADIVLQAMEKLQNDDRLRFLFIGPLHKQKQKNRKTLFANSDSGMTDTLSGYPIQYIDYVPQKQLARYIAYADLCLAGHFNAHIQKAGRTIPGKAYIYRAMQKPMILGDNPANRELFSADAFTTFVEMGNAQALADAILQQMEKTNAPCPSKPNH